MRILPKFMIFLAVLGISGVIAGCAVESIPYPRLSSVKKIKNKVLSSEEREEVIRTLSHEQEQHKTSAIREIEKK